MVARAERMNGGPGRSVREGFEGAVGEDEASSPGGPIEDHRRDRPRAGAAHTGDSALAVFGMPHALPLDHRGGLLPRGRPPGEIGGCLKRWCWTGRS